MKHDLYKSGPRIQIREWRPSLSSISGEPSVKIIDQNLTCTTSEIVSDIRPKSRFRTDNNGEWPYDPEQLMRNLVEGRKSLLDEDLQMTFLDWMESEEYDEFINQETGERIHALCSKRGNVVSCPRKSEQRNAISNAIESMKFDWSVPGTRHDRMTRLFSSPIRSITKERTARNPGDLLGPPPSRVVMWKRVKSTTLKRI